MFRYPTNIFIYGQGLGILFRSVEFLTLLTYLCEKKNLFFKRIKPVLCYEVLKKWPLLSLFPGCI